MPRGGRELPAVVAPVVPRAAGEAVRKHLLEKGGGSALRLDEHVSFIFFKKNNSTCLRGLTWSLAKGMLVIGSGSSLLR